jgi:hypothetical protein
MLRDWFILEKLCFKWFILEMFSCVAKLVDAGNVLYTNVRVYFGFPTLNSSI